MSEKNTIKVTIDGKSLSIGGYESTEYLEHVAFYINNKINEMKEMPGYSRQSAEMKTILLALNVADDYYKAKTRADALEEDIESKDGEWYSVKQDLANAQARIHELEHELAVRAASAGASHAAQADENPAKSGYAPLIQNPTSAEQDESETPTSAEQDEPDIPSADDSNDQSADAEEDVRGQNTQNAGDTRHSDRKLNDKYLKRSKRYAKNRG
jgi:cell division protein ZapA